MASNEIIQTSMAASVIGYNNDLLSEILINLPAKTLLRFKSVSKQWRFLISDRRFAINHSRNAHITSSSGVFLYHPSRRSKTLFVPFLRNPACGSVPCLSSLSDQLLPPEFAQFYRVFQSCNGLLLCLFSKDDPYCFNGKYLCVVCNPTTRDFRVLPTPPDLGTEDWLNGFALAFNPSESHHFKVVCIKISEMQQEQRKSELCIYSSETNTWKFQPSTIYIEEQLRYPQGVFLNGAVYWIGWDHTYYYNMNSQNVGVLDVPVHPPLNGFHSAAYFAESCGHLFFAVAQSWCHPRYYIFELDNVSMRWSDAHVEYLSWTDYLNWYEYFGNYGTEPTTSVMAVSRREDEDDDCEFVFSLTTPNANRLIIANSAMSRHVEDYDVTNIFSFLSCEYVQSLAPI